MPFDEADVQAWAGRVRPYFPSAEQDTAEVAAYWFATVVGSQVKALRPETSMTTVLSWIKSAPRGFLEANWVETLMAVEEEVWSAVTDTFAETLETRTFGEYVHHLVEQSRPNKSLERTRGE